MTTESLSAKPTVFILNLDKEQEYEGLFDQIYGDLIDSLASKYRVQRARKLNAAQNYLNAQKPIAILLPDPAVTQDENIAVLRQVSDYVQAGGLAIFSCNFSSFISPSVMDNFWETTWGLGWKFGSYHRTSVHLNRY